MGLQPHEERGVGKPLPIILGEDVMDSPEGDPPTPMSRTGRAELLKKMGKPPAPTEPQSFASPGEGEYPVESPASDPKIKTHASLSLDEEDPPTPMSRQGRAALLQQKKG